MTPKDGDRVKVGDIEGVWEGFVDGRHYCGYLTADDGWRVSVIKGVPVTVVRPVECDHRWVYDNYGQYVCRRCGLHVERLVPEREPVDLAEAVGVWQSLPGSEAIARAVLEWAGVPVKDAS